MSSNDSENDALWEIIVKNRDTDHANDLADLREEHADKKKDLEDKIEGLNEKLKASEHKRLDFRRNLRQEKEHSKVLQEKLDEFKVRAAAKSDNIKGLKKNISELKSELARKTADFTKLHSDKDLLEKFVLSLQDDSHFTGVGGEKPDVNPWNLDLDTCRRFCIELQVSTRVARRAHHVVAKKMDEYKLQAQDCMSRMGEMQYEMQDTERTNTAQLLRERRRQIEEYQVDYDLLKAEHERLHRLSKADKVKFDHELKMLSASLEQSQETVALLQGRVDVLQEFNDHITTELKRKMIASDVKEVLNVHYELKCADNGLLAERVLELEGQLKDASAALGAAKHRMQELEGQLSSENDRVKELEDSSLYLENRVTGLDFQMHGDKIDAEKKITALESSLREKEDSINQLRNARPDEIGPRLQFYFNQKDIALNIAKNQAAYWQEQASQLQQAAGRQSFWNQFRACMDAMADRVTEVTQARLQTAEANVIKLQDYLKEIGYFHAFNEQKKVSELADPDLIEQVKPEEAKGEEAETDPMDLDQPEE